MYPFHYSNEDFCDYIAKTTYVNMPYLFCLGKHLNLILIIPL